MLQFNKELGYSLQFIFALSNLNKNELLGLRKFSDEKNISFLFLQRIARKLRQGGIIQSIKGATGGYYLKKSLTKISLKDLLEVLDGEYAVIDCLKSDVVCPKEKNCTAHKVFKKVNNSLLDYLGKIKLSELLED
ncbi:MAG TPA: Rrf2 family transcriptional regulator [Candidatus Magasanikbacteria bacterium]|jgi:Rrf2 family protein|nr:Rrf2 family transcriptional regulator [Candidatus Magasanikbacteria bacterium]NLZ97034.1 Rrf2 family transcriptional regulator [Candidatus Magasanikbacteria bacterium]HQF57294.1 Rrf2 family transcriptional regulator [Candidatus Magasanikbacteria bacterium]HQL52540.1 Rrf2 family transcriptional regulator [Candidatus Magasanikbacteria bacterium]